LKVHIIDRQRNMTDLLCHKSIPFEGKLAVLLLDVISKYSSYNSSVFDNYELRIWRLPLRTEECYQQANPLSR